MSGRTCKECGAQLTRFVIENRDLSYWECDDGHREWEMSPQPLILKIEACDDSFYGTIVSTASESDMLMAAARGAKILSVIPSGLSLEPGEVLFVRGEVIPATCEMEEAKIAYDNRPKPAPDPRFAGFEFGIANDESGIIVERIEL